MCGHHWVWMAVRLVLGVWREAGNWNLLLPMWRVLFRWLPEQQTISGGSPFFPPAAFSRTFVGRIWNHLVKDRLLVSQLSITVQSIEGAWGFFCLFFAEKQESNKGHSTFLFFSLPTSSQLCSNEWVWGFISSRHATYWLCELEQAS